MALSCFQAGCREAVCITIWFYDMLVVVLAQSQLRSAIWPGSWGRLVQRRLLTNCEVKFSEVLWRQSFLLTGRGSSSVAALFSCLTLVDGYKSRNVLYGISNVAHETSWDGTDIWLAGHLAQFGCNVNQWYCFTTCWSRIQYLSLDVTYVSFAHGALLIMNWFVVLPDGLAKQML